MSKSKSEHPNQKELNQLKLLKFIEKTNEYDDKIKELQESIDLLNGHKS